MEAPYLSTTTSTRRGLRLWPALILGLGLVYVASALRPQAADDGYDLAGFGRLPVVNQGRVKPLDTLARISLMVISNKQSMRTEGVEVPAVRWLLDAFARREAAETAPVIRIDHPDVLSLMGYRQERKYFSLAEVREHAGPLNDQFNSARDTPGRQRTIFQRKALELAQRLRIYVDLMVVERLILVPPATADQEWQTLAAAAHLAEAHGRTGKPEALIATILEAWRQRQPEAFNQAVADYGALLDQRLPGVMAKVRFEAFFNRMAPFMKTMALYVLVFVLAAASWLIWPRVLARSALWVLLLALAVHTFGLVARMYIQGRPPVTNLYSSAVFCGFGCVVLGAILERFFRNGIGSVAAAVAGFLSLLVAHNLGSDGDTMTMMAAVLDTNFWLATHVVVIALGYSACFLAAFLAAIYIIGGVFTPALTPAHGQALARTMFGIICFAALFSFAGTVLGGIWADQSWGRFWGWDPKENGALLIVLWCALVLHAHWGRMIKGRGLAVLSVFGGIVTSWSWFGTNQLGVGLHSYGFMESTAFWLLLFVASQLLLMAIGLVPTARWRSPMQQDRAAAPDTAAARLMPSE